ncbi:TonB-dependent receptor plug domain-containing protein [Pedobacter sp. LMG 31464]|uniref:TonB-dependent receptor plug domain-containing protein n=1 Tax=Pedobacter planticolens TaxID=2679964 RepID=A0A923DW45_9SPHI|nr:TonB-dependent receptor [Pedobacter planticolens]MBB2144146.1 TonB-dependent receptor plug domain-containing protein [Pedobacter planticolens]
MKKIFTKVIFMLLMLLTTGVVAHAQSIVVSGTVTDKLTKEPIPGVSVTVKGKTIGSSTDLKGQFSFSTTEKAPFTLMVSYIGFTTVEREVSGNTANLTFELESGTILGQEVVVSASRTPERILESPVSIERISSAALKELPAPSFYDALNNLKGVEMSTQSMTFRSVNTRGFNANGNVRFNQYIDGMDNQAPGLNFSVGNIVGLTELDVDNVELLPGAASALYGAGGINGTLLMTSKNPYQYQGASFQYKTGINHVSDDKTSQGVQEFKELNVRLAKSWNNKFGFKTSFGFLQAKDWAATDTRNFDRTARQLKSGDRNSDPNYDGINVYGDEISQNMVNVAQSVNAANIAGINTATAGAIPNIQTQLNGIFNLLSVPANGLPTAAQQATALGFLPAALRPTVQAYLPFYIGLRSMQPGQPVQLLSNQFVSRTGYNETDLVDYDTKSLKTSTSLHYKFNNTVEAIAQANWGTGTSVYTGTDRYSLRNFKIGQYKLELKGQDFFLRGYTTQERSGEAYNATILGTFINEAWKPSTTWFPQYIGNYIGARGAGQSDAAAQAFARSQADIGRLIPGSAGYETAKSTIASKTIGPANGAKFNDKTNLYHYEGMYNFSNAFNNVVELIVGASYRDYFLHSDGTIFDDANRDIVINEYGAYAQLGKKFGDKFKMTVAGRYDKSKNFEGRLTPRITGVWTVAPNNNIRASFQTGYRNPTTQDQYIDLAVGGGSTRLIGGLPESINKYNLNTNKGVTSASYKAFLASAAAGAPNPALLQQYTFDAGGLRPESVKSFEVGYKGLATRSLLIDAYAYYNIYEDFIGGVELYQNPTTAAVKFSVPVNIATKVKSYGAAFGLDYQVGKFNFNGNTSYNKLSDIPAGFDNNFNTPEWRFNAGVGSKEIVKNFGFNVQYRWQDEFYWNSTFATGTVPAYSTFDAQVNLKIPSVKSVVKLGGSNVLNKYYSTSFGNPEVGALYYLSFTFNP